MDFKKTMDKAIKACDANYGKYKMPNGRIVEVVNRRDLHGVDTVFYKDGSDVRSARWDWFETNAKKV